MEWEKHRKNLSKLDVKFTLLPSWQAGCEQSVSTKVTSDFNRPRASYCFGSDSKGHFNCKNLQLINRAFRNSTTNSDSLNCWHSSMSRCFRKSLKPLFRSTKNCWSVKLHSSKTTWTHKKYKKVTLCNVQRSIITLQRVRCPGCWPLQSLVQSQKKQKQPQQQSNVIQR